MYHVLPKHLKPCQLEYITYIDYILRGYNFTYIEHGTDIEDWLSASHIFTEFYVIYFKFCVELNYSLLATSSLWAKRSPTKSITTGLKLNQNFIARASFHRSFGHFSY